MVEEIGNCWRCGTTEKITKHHVIPKSLKPKLNMTIPLCRPCHDEWHGQEKNRKKMFKKIEKTSKELQDLVQKTKVFDE